MKCICCCLSKNQGHHRLNVDDDEVRPLLGREDSKSYDYGSNAPAVGEYKSPREQKLAITGLFISQFFRVIAFQITMNWIPNFAALTLKKGSIANARMGTVSLLASVVEYCSSPLIGILSDAFVKKTAALLIGTVLMIIGYGYISSIAFDVAHNLESCQNHDGNNSEPQNTTCNVDGLVTTGSLEARSALVYLITSCVIISLSESIFYTIVPALAGDQVSSIRGVRSLYVLYYWVWKLGDVFALFFTLAIPDLSYITSPPVVMAASVVTIVCIVLSALFMVTVIGCKLTRQTRPNVAVLIDTVLIWREAFQRKRERPGDVSCIHMASYSQGGSFPDMAVLERKRIGLFCVTLLCFLPVSFMTLLPTYESIDHNETEWISTHGNVTINGIQAGFYSELSEQLARVVTIPAVYVISYFLREKVQVTILHRLVCGHICILLSSSCTLIIPRVTSETETSFYTAMITANVFMGMCNSFIYTAGFELALLTAPRSMQATAMGMSAAISSGIAYTMFFIFFLIDYHPSAKLTPAVYGVGIGFVVVAIALLIVLDRKLDLGLNKHYF